MKNVSFILWKKLQNFLANPTVTCQSTSIHLTAKISKMELLISPLVSQPAVWHHHKFGWWWGGHLFFSILHASYFIYRPISSTTLLRHMLNPSLPAFTTVITRSKPLSSLTWTTARVSRLISHLPLLPPVNLPQDSQGDQPSETASDHATPLLKHFPTKK